MPASPRRCRAEVLGLVGADLSKLKPGSKEATALKSALTARGAWSQYLEVGIGPDAEVFTKAPVLSAVGTGACAGLHPLSSGTIPNRKWSSRWPRPAGSSVRPSATTSTCATSKDVPLFCSARPRTTMPAPPSARFCGCSTTRFRLRPSEREEVTLTVTGADGFVLEGRSSMQLISRQPQDIVRQTIGPHHRYPGRVRALPRDHVRAGQDRDATRPRLHAQAGRHCGGRFADVSERSPT